MFELNTNLLDRVMNLTQGIKLNDSSVAQEYRKKFDFAPANEAPVVTSCDTCVVPSSSSSFRALFRSLAVADLSISPRPQPLLRRLLCWHAPLGDLGQLH